MQIINKINEISQRKASVNYFTNVYGLARTLLSIGTLLTLIAGKAQTFFPSAHGKTANFYILTESMSCKYNFFLLFGFANVSLMSNLAIICLLIIASGFYPRYTCILHWWISLSFIFASSAVDGGDQIAANVSLLLIPICLLDSRRWHWSSIQTQIQSDHPTIKNLITYSTVTMIRLQVAVIYFHSAIGKFKVEEWLDGTATYYWLNNTFFRMPRWSEYFLQPIISNDIGVILLTWGTIVLELSLFLCLLTNQRIQRRMLVVGLVFHFSILVLHGLFSFFFSIVAALILYLYPLNKPIDFKLNFLILKTIKL